jgi:hypothetical protein
MPLNPSALSSGLQSTFADPPPTAAGCAQGWADAVQSWCSSIVPASAGVAGAVATLQGALAGAFAGTDAASALESAFSAFAVTVGGGMAGYVPTPPPGPVGFATQFAGPKPATHADAASMIANLIDVWMRTGIGTLIAPPGTIVPWS